MLLRLLLLSSTIMRSSSSLTRRLVTCWARGSPPPGRVRSSRRLGGVRGTDGEVVGGALEGVADEADDVSEGEHPDPLGLRLVPDQQFFDRLVDEDVNRAHDAERLVDRAHLRVDGDAVVRRVRQQDVRNQALQRQLTRNSTTILLDYALLYSSIIIIRGLPRPYSTQNLFYQATPLHNLSSLTPRQTV